jgi:hypothetical protein
VNDLTADKEDEVAILLAAALQHGLKEPKWEPNWECRQPQHLTRGIQEQTRIGWQQILFGRIARGLVPEDAKVSLQCRKALRKIWDTFLVLWQQ